MKQLPIWQSSFENIRDNDVTLYIDKTKYIWDILSNQKKPKIFLSRPRRFGKSLLLDTFRWLFEWKKEYFKNLYIENKWDWSKKNTYPIIKIVFWVWIIEDKKYLQDGLNDIIYESAEEHNIKIESKSISWKFKELLRKIYKKYNKRVVVLIDEYDKPILDKINSPEIAKEIREELKWFYSTLKWVDEYLRFVFITWVSKFSQVSLFSWLNNLEDITLDSKYASICWYTWQEILDNFWPEWYLKWVDLEKMKLWYNWYNFNWREDEKVYNPFWVLNFFKKKEYLNYWFQTATPTFLIKLLEEKNYPLLNFEEIEAWAKILDSFDIEKIDLWTLMFQTGYLTIKEKLSFGWITAYKLWIPNEEVRQSIHSYIVSDYLWFEDSNDKYSKIRNIHRVIWAWKIEEFIEIVKSIFAWIPYSSYTKNDISKYEWFYTSVLYSFLAATWIEFIAEDFTNKWRIDFTLKYKYIDPELKKEKPNLKELIYIIELKVEKSWEEALKQIKTKKYEEKYIWNWKEIYLLWLNFDSKKKNLGESNWEKVKIH